MIELTNFKEYKEKYPYYCEVIIDCDGHIYEARPSHQQALLQLYAEKHNVEINDVLKKFYNDIDWLDHASKDVGHVMFVWYENIEWFMGTLTFKQIESVRKLYKEGLINYDIDNELGYPYYIVTDDKHYIWHHSSELYVDATMIFGAGKEPCAYDMYIFCKENAGEYSLDMSHKHPGL